MAYTKEEIERMKKALGITDSDESGDNKDTSTDLSNLEYILMPKADTYALGVEALQNSCNVDPSNAQFMFTQDDTSRIIRPLTFEENIKARVDDYETLFDKNGNERDLEARKRLFQIGLDSCTGIAYKAKTTKFKILNECSELINIASNFNSKYLPINYRGINSIELDSSQGVYNKLLTPEQILEHPAWNTAVQDKSLLKTYRDIVFKLNPGDERMRFWVRQNTAKDELRALYVYNIVNDSSAYGNYDLNYYAYFLRVTQKAP